MSTDILRSESNERVDLSDYRFATDGMIQALASQLGSEFLTDPSKTRTFIISGFETTNPVGNQIQVDKGRALLAHREGGQVFEGHLTTFGDANKIIDTSGFGDGTYGVFVRFEYVDGDSSSRVFWNPAGNGSEFAQTIATRRKANWSMRIEIGSPGSEWTQVGEVVMVGGSISVGPTDKRVFYFEGDVDASYESGWSTDGGGAGLDRDSNRADNGISDLQSFSGAMRQCLEDIKGRGLRRWWERDIGGMNIGFDAAPVEDVLAVGDSNFNLSYNATTPSLFFDVGDEIEYVRNAETFGEYRHKVVGLTRMTVNQNGVRAIRGLYVGDISTGTINASDVMVPDGGINVGGSTNPTQGEGIFIDGLVVGYDANPNPDRVSVGDANTYLELNVDSRLNLDVNDYLLYDRSENHYLFNIQAASRFEISLNGIRILKSTVPASPLEGDLYLDSVSGLPSVRRNSTEWARVSGVVHTVLADEDRTTSGDYSTSQYTIPANTLNVGSKVHVKAGGAVTGDGGGGNVSLDLDINGGTQLGTTTRTIASGENFYFDAVGVCRVTGAGGSFFWSGIAVFGQGGTDAEVVCSTQIDSAPTNAGIVLSIDLTLTVGGGGNNVRLNNFIVEISD